MQAEDIAQIVGEDEAAPKRASRKKEIVREALGSDIVRQAADILGAQVHDVKVDNQK